MNSSELAVYPVMAAAMAEAPEHLTDTQLSNDTAKDYIRQLTTPLLNAEQEVELAKRIEAGKYATQLLLRHETNASATLEELEWLAQDGNQAFEHLFKANLRLVVSLAARKQSIARHMDFMDLVSEGNFGLWHAIEKFDYTRGIKFSTYATRWINKDISQAIYDQNRLIRLPREQEETLRKVKATADTHESITGVRPSNQAIAETLGMPLQVVQTLRPYEIDHTSLDQPISLSQDKPVTLGDIIAITPDTHEATEKLREELVHNWMLRHACSVMLSSRNADIMNRLFGLDGSKPQSRADIARSYGLRGPSIGYARDRALQLFATMPQLRELYDAS